jgi:hypothetical protein
LSIGVRPTDVRKRKRWVSEKKQKKISRPVFSWLASVDNVGDEHGVSAAKSNR